MANDEFMKTVTHVRDLTDSIREANFRRNDFQKWLYYSDPVPKNPTAVFNRESYLAEVVKSNGGRRPTTLDIYPYTGFYTCRIYDIGVVNTTTESSQAMYRSTKKVFRKTLKEFDIMTCICKRFLRIENAIYAYYHCLEQDTLFSRFTNRNDLSFFDEFLHISPTGANSENHGIAPVHLMIPQIIPYIRFNLIEIGEFMGVSYYDILELVHKNYTIHTPEEEMLYIFQVLYRQYTVAEKSGLVVHQSMPINQKMIETFLSDRTHYESLVMKNFTNEFLGILTKVNDVFYNYNDIEPILLTDYLTGTYRFTSLFTDRYSDDLSKVEAAYGLTDLYDAIVVAIQKYDELKKYIANSPGKITWQYDLIFSNKYRDTVNKIYLGGGDIFSKKQSKNPDNLLSHSVDFWSYLFNDFESTVQRAIDVL